MGRTNNDLPFLLPFSARNVAITKKCLEGSVQNGGGGGDVS